MKTVIEMAREAGFDSAPNGHMYHPDTNDEHSLDKYLEAFAELVRADEREETDCLRALCEELLSELYVYRASKYLKDTTDAIRTKGLA